MSFAANGIVSLSTDFGLREPFVGLMKAVILRRHPAARIVDLCHELPAFQPDVAGFWLSRCWQYFPAGTVHLAVVDPGVGGPRAMRLVQVAGQLFVAPDNGLLNKVEAHVDWEWSRRVELGELAALRLGAISNTFHGRDVFAPLVAALASGGLAPETLGQEAARAALSTALRRPDNALGQVLIIDRFGNLITGIETEVLLEKGINHCQIAGQVIEITNTYSSVPTGKLLALVNSFGLLEIAVAEGSAAEALGARIGTPVFLGA